MKILIIGDGNSIHIRNYMNVVLEGIDDIQITLFDINSQKNKNIEIYDYFSKKNIHVVSNNGLDDLVKNKFIRKINKIRTLCYLFKLNSRLRRLGKFDYCLLHYVDIIKTLLIIKNKKRFQRIIPVFWGSDLLRNNKIGGKSYEKLFHLSYKIVFNTQNMKRQFNNYYGKRFENKSEIIKFPTLSFKTIDKIENRFTKNELKKHLNLPLDKFIIMCGHAGFRAEQHEKLLDAISKCDKSVINKCYFVFPMTYGASDLVDRQKQIMSFMKNNSIKGQVLCDYLINEEMLKIIICTDIFINVIKTDAFSGVMQENIYSGSLVIYGNWLNYYELENGGIIAQPVDTISDIPNIIESTIINYETLNLDLKGNRKLISNISSPRSIRTFWREYIFEI